MHYLVTARLIPETASALRAALDNKTIARQKPDGAEIVASMKRAVVTPTGQVEWSEVCYCSPPLAHERATVYDRFFSELRTEPVDDYQFHEGRPFLDWLDELADDAG